MLPYQLHTGTTYYCTRTYGTVRLPVVQVEDKGTLGEQAKPTRMTAPGFILAVTRLVSSRVPAKRHDARLRPVLLLMILLDWPVHRHQLTTSTSVRDCGCDR